MKSSVIVGLLWHDPTSANLGVGALTHAQMHLLREAADDAGVMLNLIAIGWCLDGRSSSGAISETCNVNAKRLLGIDPTLRRTLARCDLILDIGEGDSFSDIYGWKRLIYLLGTKFLAYRRKRPLIMSPQTIGPFRGSFAAWLADRAMNRARMVCSRDTLSTQYLRSRKLAVPQSEVVDVAFSLPYQSSSAPSSKTRIGINVSGLLWAGGYSEDNQFGLQLDYRATIRELVDHFSRLPDVEVVLVPHVVTRSRSTEDDFGASELLAREFKGVEVAGPFPTPMAAKAYISTCHFFVGARMHACIAAFSSGVPCVPMAYSRKFSGLFASLGYPHVADCTKEDQATATAKILNAYEQRDKLKQQVIASNQIAHQRLDQYKQLLTLQLREVARA